MRKTIYGRSYGFGDKFTGKWAQDRPGCERFRVVVICEGEERGKIVGKIIAAYPRDGAGTLYVDLFDWTGSHAVVWHGRAGGYGNDKLGRALQGCKFGPDGAELGENWEGKLRAAGYYEMTLL